MKIAICDYKEPLNRDLNIEKNIFKKFLGEDTEISLYVHEGNEQAFKDAIADVEGILTSYLEFPKEIIQSNPHLKGISIEATGYNFVDADAAQAQNTAVTVIGEYCTQEVADHAMALMLAVARKLKHYDREIEYKHVYDYNSTSGMIRLEGSTFGILGLGKIGKAVARRAQGFGMHVIAYSPTCQPEVAQALGVKLVSKEELFETSDVISVHMRLTDKNVNMLNREAFAMMKKKPIIVNVSRGAMIDEEALLEALNTGRIFGAGLDVLVEETNENTKKSPLVGREDVILTPHMAFYSDFSLYECQRIAAENLCYVLLGQQEKIFKMVNEVDVTQFAK